MRHAASPVTPRPRRLSPEHGRSAVTIRHRVILLLLLALIRPAGESLAQDGTAAPPAPSFTPPAAFPAPATREVLTTALAFLEPRTLEPHSARELCLWGLDGLTAIDPTISVSVIPAETAAAKPGSEGPVGMKLPESVVVTGGQAVLFSRPAPPPSDNAAWADLVVAAMQTAWNRSATIRQAGSDAPLQGFFDELFNHMDPYSRYLAPAPAGSDRTKRTGDDGTDDGATVGLTLAQKGRAIVVQGVNANGPGWEAGIDVGERLLAVNGRSTRGQTAETVLHWLDGPRGSHVRLTLASGGRAGTTLDLQRAEVPPETVFESREGGVMTLRIVSFSAQTAEEISQYLDQAAQNRPSGAGGRLSGVVIDLRGNRGGVLQQAVTAAALFLDRGVAVTTYGRDPQANHIWAVQGGDMTGGAPIVVLVDGRTASASEILAAALADHRRAVVVGSETLGKGLVQVIGQMPNGGELFVTWSRNEAPLGWPIQGLGVMPQICTSRGADDARAQLAELAQGASSQAEGVRLSREARYPLPVARILDIRRHCPAALGTDLDVEVAHAVLSAPKVYQAAIGLVPDEGTVPLH